MATELPEKLADVQGGLERLSLRLEEELTAIANQRSAEHARLADEIGDLQRVSESLQAAVDALVGLDAAAGQAPGAASAAILIAPRTYDAAHSGYNSDLVRNWPGRMLNAVPRLDNPVYRSLQEICEGGAIAQDRWARVIDAALGEAMEAPECAEILAAQERTEEELARLSRAHEATYLPGWVNQRDAALLFWAVRRLQPKVVVQTGVCNGVSSAFILLGLRMNGDGGVLHAVDLPFVLDPDVPGMCVPGAVYGHTIPPGRSPGWIVPGSLRSSFHLTIGDAREELPRVLRGLGEIDLFYHDSEHTYRHMAYEFALAAAHLRPGGVVVSDNIACNSSLWDFADRHHAPAFNHEGSMGLVCF